MIKLLKRFDWAAYWAIVFQSICCLAIIVIGWFYPDWLMRQGRLTLVSTTAIIIVVFSLIDYTVKVNKTLKHAEIIEREVTKHADAFFHEYHAVKNLFFGKHTDSATKITICAPFPFHVLKEFKSQLEHILKRGGKFELILPDPGSAADTMSVERATADENEKRKKNVGELKSLLVELEAFSKAHPASDGGFYLKTTTYWPSCIYTYAQTQHGDRDERAILVTINNYGLNDKRRRSFIVEETKEPKTFSIFKDDLDNITMKAVLNKVDTIIKEL
jgi:hypothetical protein